MVPIPHKFHRCEVNSQDSQSQQFLQLKKKRLSDPKTSLTIIQTQKKTYFNLFSSSGLVHFQNKINLPASVSSFKRFLPCPWLKTYSKKLIIQNAELAQNNFIQKAAADKHLKSLSFRAGENLPLLKHLCSLKSLERLDLTITAKYKEKPSNLNLSKALPNLKALKLQVAPDEGGLHKLRWLRDFFAGLWELENLQYFAFTLYVTPFWSEFVDLVLSKIHRVPDFEISLTGDSRVPINFEKYGDLLTRVEHLNLQPKVIDRANKRMLTLSYPKRDPVVNPLLQQCSSLKIFIADFDTFQRLPNDFVFPQSLQTLEIYEDSFSCMSEIEHLRNKLAQVQKLKSLSIFLVSKKCDDGLGSPSGIECLSKFLKSLKHLQKLSFRADGFQSFEFFEDILLQYHELQSLELNVVIKQNKWEVKIPFEAFPQLTHFSFITRDVSQESTRNLMTQICNSKSLKSVELSEYLFQGISRDQKDKIVNCLMNTKGLKVLLKW